MSRSTSSRSLLSALCAGLVASTLLLVPSAEATAVARTISIAATPTAKLGGQPVTFVGKLSKSPKGSAVKIQRKVGTTWKLAKATTTKNAAGNYAVAVALPAKAGIYKYRAFAPRKGSLRAATSKVISVTALRKTTFYKIDGTNEFVMISNSSSSSASGSLNAPYALGAKATLQRKVGATWVNVGTGTVGAYGVFQIAYPAPQSGSHRVYISRKGLNSAAASIPRNFVFV